MTTEQLAVRKNLYREINRLEPDDVDKLACYAAFLRHLEDKEDAEDTAYIEAHKDEPSIPLEQAMKELGL